MPAPRAASRQTRPAITSKSPTVPAVPTYFTPVLYLPSRRRDDARANAALGGTPAHVSIEVSMPHASSSFSGKTTVGSQSTNRGVEDRAHCDSAGRLFPSADVLLTASWWSQTQASPPMAAHPQGVILYELELWTRACRFERPRHFSSQLESAATTAPTSCSPRASWMVTPSWPGPPSWTRWTPPSAPRWTPTPTRCPWGRTRPTGMCVTLRTAETRKCAGHRDATQATPLHAQCFSDHSAEGVFCLATKPAAPFGYGDEEVEVVTNWPTALQAKLMKIAFRVRHPWGKH